ncbi:MAG: acyl-CoA dehydrogenase family protein [Alphaproteobacteria bacterium]|nr:acyl-CoA dehydrogenase family protein [Alphaproteobacteria bacterium]MBU0798193.1 acyl-CoA dehydrogenase family protein [Alphaproteobacteria bacterium]MBU0887589.1 acyl-CoA dehydrogenase family protein [Alphaproteobacteria bacterium]MBU1814240.1 acyl-CoA dehydrogenase family protein [Alphaproteobacteria bacterium]MBU2089219.1 acyl-CoA dehydrogenase family protein [Alphaproteobacteria bacterium]
MDFTVPEELTALGESVARFCETEIIPAMPEYEKKAEFCYPLIAKMGDAGFFGASFPEELGGSAAGFQAVSIIAEEISRLAPEFGYAMNMQAMTCPYTIYNWGTEDQARRFVPDLIAGRKIGMFALSEAGGGSDPAGAMKTTARRDGDVYRLNGSKMWITFSHAADTGVLLAKTDPSAGHKGITAFIVQPKAFEGYTAHPIEMGGLSKSLRSCTVFLDDFPVPVEDRLGEEGQGFRIAMNALEYGRLTVSARLVGLAQAALDASVAFANDRVVGGRPIAQYQMIQQRIADATVAVDAARLMARRIGWTMDRGETSTRIAARSKYFATQTARLAADVAREVFGGYALADEYPVRKISAYIDMLTVGEGSENVQRVLIAEDALGIKDAQRHSMRNKLMGRV